MNKIRLLVNLPPTFFTHPRLEGQFQRLRGMAEVRQTSHNILEEILPDLPWAQAVIMWAWPILDEEILAGLPELRFVGQINTMEKTARACLARGITLSEARRCWSPAVAEMALALILSGLRKISDYHAAMRQGKETWVRQHPADIDPLERELSGLEVGIIGFGGIGQRLAQLLEPFGVRLSVYDPYLPAGVAEQFKVAQLPLIDLIRGSDVVVLAAANNPRNRHMIGEEEMAAFRKDAVLANVARSMLIDMEALQRRLEKGDLIALLDVFDKEPLEADSPLRGIPNAYLTPHRAGGLLSSVERGLTMLVDDLEAYLEGRELCYKVTEEMFISFA